MTITLFISLTAISLLILGLLLGIYGGDKYTSTTGFNFGLPSIKQLFGAACIFASIVLGIILLISLFF